MDNNKEILMELAKQLISEEELMAAIRSVVRERLNYHLENELRQIVHEILDEKGKDFIVEMIENALKQPVKKDDGWGHVEKFDSFENFVREEIKKRTYDRSQWDIQGSIRGHIENKIKEVAKKLTEQESKDRSAEILHELAKELTEEKKK